MSSNRCAGADRETMHRSCLADVSRTLKRTEPDVLILQFAIAVRHDSGIGSMQMLRYLQNEFSWENMLLYGYTAAGSAMLLLAVWVSGGPMIRQGHID